jgi:hypothetical protein
VFVPRSHRPVINQDAVQFWMIEMCHEGTMMMVMMELMILHTAQHFSMMMIDCCDDYCALDDVFEMVKLVELALIIYFYKRDNNNNK